MEDELPDNPGVIAPPPLIYAGPLILGLILQALFPVSLVRFLPRMVRLILGSPLIGFACTLIAIAFRTMRRANTNVDPREPATTLVVEGPFQMTRNPLYLSMTIFYIGVTFLANTLWTILLLPLTLIVMRKGVIDREERYLERKFGEQYLRYKSNVRRWL
jgi:protein-S-isoprenylcysteine O-methyltransferase Ste14